MRRLWEHGWKRLDLEAEFRAGRPEPRPELLQMLAERTREGVGARPRTRAPRLALATGLTAAILAALASVGGFGYAASAVMEATRAVRTLVAKQPASEERLARVSAGGDQYQPGFGWGDPNHNHTGPPGLTRPGEFAPPLRTSCTGRVARISTRVVIDEQADLRVSVLGPNGERLLLLQKGSRIGGPVSGPPTKTIRYRLLIPRLIRITLAIPCNLLAAGETYRIRINATDPDGQTSTLVIRFRVETASA